MGSPVEDLINSHKSGPVGCPHLLGKVNSGNQEFRLCSVLAPTPTCFSFQGWPCAVDSEMVRGFRWRSRAPIPLIFNNSELDILKSRVQSERREQAVQLFLSSKRVEQHDCLKRSGTQGSEFRHAYFYLPRSALDLPQLLSWRYILGRYFVDELRQHNVI